MNADVVQEEKSSVLEDVKSAFQNEDYTKVITICEKYLKERKDDITAWHLLGTACARIGKFEKAEQAFRKELEIDPRQVDAYFNLGLIYNQQQKPKEAITNFEKAIELRPDDLQSLNDLGVLYFNIGEKDKAGECFTKALKSNPTYKDAFLNAFEILWNECKYSTAMEHAYEYLNKLSQQGEGVTLEKSPVAMKTEKPEILQLENEGSSFEIPTTAPGIISTETRKKTSSKVEDLFNKHVPVKLHGKKTGMNIAVVADFNIAGQLTQLFRLINEKTIHRARCIIMQDDYLTYDNDLILSRGKDDEWEEARLVIQNADFLHIGRFPKQPDNFELLNYLKPDNTIVQYFGSELRQNASAIYDWHTRNKITGVAAWDYTMIQNSPFFYHINMMYDTSKIKSAPKPEGTLKIVHPTTNRSIKKTELFVEAMKKLTSKYDIEPIIIEGKTNEECLELKSQAHMTFDQISVGIYGVSAIESMAAGHVVFGGISNFAASVYPDNPVVYITPDNIVEQIKHYVVNRVEIISKGLAGKAWVKQYHDPQKLLRQHMYLYDLVRFGHRFMSSSDEQMLG